MRRGEKRRENAFGRTIDESDARARVVRYESLTAYLADCNPDAKTWGSGREWNDGVSPKEALRRGRDGDPSLVRAYEGHIQDLTATMRGEVGPAWVLDVMGSTPCSPAVVAGHPMAMRRRVKRSAPARTARIYVSLICSAGIRASDMVKRGASILALAESLQAANVHVEINLVCELPCSPRDTIVIVPIETPLDLSVSGFAIAHPAFTRYVTYYLNGNQWGFNGGWPRYMDHSDSGRKTGAKILKLEPGDVWVPSASLLDDSVQNPAAWIQRNVMQVLGETQEAS